MKVIEINEALNISFDDYTVISSENLHEKYIMHTNGVVINDGNNTLDFSSCKVIIESYTSLHIKSYDHTLEEWECCTEKQEVKDICEFILDKDILLIRGFGKHDGKWTEYKFIAPKKIEIELP
ncbi:hypothetical protein [Enterobacter sp.]|uniref:hypothetical protein n=1 Tax=Enterobacter sp. TaxID=42895 RepID=UPI00296FEB73|nr:hypothetical protein [Enterobacter sp.]